MLNPQASQNYKIYKDSTVSKLEDGYTYINCAIAVSFLPSSGKLDSIRFMSCNLANIRFNKNAHLTNCEFSKIDDSYFSTEAETPSYDASSFVFSDIKISNSKFQHVNLRKLKNVVFENCTFSSCNFIDSSEWMGDIRNVEFKNCTFVGSLFHLQPLYSGAITFQGVRLHKVSVSGIGNFSILSNMLDGTEKDDQFEIKLTAQQYIDLKKSKKKSDQQDFKGKFYNIDVRNDEKELMLKILEDFKDDSDFAMIINYSQYAKLKKMRKIPSDIKLTVDGGYLNVDQEETFTEVNVDELDLKKIPTNVKIFRCILRNFAVSGDHLLKGNIQDVRFENPDLRGMDPVLFHARLIEGVFSGDLVLDRPQVKYLCEEGLAITFNSRASFVLSNLDLSGLDFTKIHNLNAVFFGCNLTKVKFGSDLDQVVIDNSHILVAINEKPSKFYVKPIMDFCAAAKSPALWAFMNHLPVSGLSQELRGKLQRFDNLINEIAKDLERYYQDVNELSRKCNSKDAQKALLQLYIIKLLISFFRNKDVDLASDLIDIFLNDIDLLQVEVAAKRSNVVSQSTSFFSGIEFPSFKKIINTTNQSIIDIYLQLKTPRPRGSTWLEAPKQSQSKEGDGLHDDEKIFGL